MDTKPLHRRFAPFAKTAALLFLLSSCASSMRNLQNPSYSIRDIEPRIDIALPLSASSIDFDFTLGVDNPNDVRLKLAGVDLAVLINDQPVLNHVNTYGPVDIPARGIGEVRMRARADYRSMQNLFMSIADAVRGRRASYRIEGTAYYHTMFGNLSFPIHTRSLIR